MFYYFWKRTKTKLKRIVESNGHLQFCIYEAAVKSIKHHLVRTIGETTLTFEEYATLLRQTEAYVNSRPLTPLNDDPTSLNALMPGHFLIGEPLVKLPEKNMREIPDNRLTRWNHVQKMSQNFWD